MIQIPDTWSVPDFTHKYQLRDNMNYFPILKILGIMGFLAILHDKEGHDWDFLNCVQICHTYAYESYKICFV